VAICEPLRLILMAIALAGTSRAAAQRREASGCGTVWAWRRDGRGSRATSAPVAGRRLSLSLESAAAQPCGAHRRGARGWREREGGVTQTLLSFGAAAYWYPSVGRQLYLRGGAALVMHRTNDAPTSSRHRESARSLASVRYPVSRSCGWRRLRTTRGGVGA